MSFNILDLKHVHIFIVNPMIPEDWIWTCEHVEDPKCLKLVGYFCFYAASTKTSFGFCSGSEFLQLKYGKKICREIQIAQLPRQLQTWLRLQMNHIYHIYNFVQSNVVPESVQVPEKRTRGQKSFRTGPGTARNSKSVLEQQPAALKALGQF